MKTITINSDKYNLPTRWNELNSDQFRHIATLSLQQLTPAEFKLKAVLLLLNITVESLPEQSVKAEPCYYIRHGKNTYLVSTHQLMAISEQMKFLFDIVETSDGHNYQLNCKLFRQLIPEIKVAGHTFYGPDDALTNILFKEYIRAETYFSEFLSKKDKANADRLIATMYRPQAKAYNPEDVNFSGDRREPINDFLIENRAKVISKLDDVTRQAILMWYEGCKHFLSTKYARVFEEGDNQKISGKQPDIFENYMRLLATLSNNDATRTDDWLNTNLHMVMLTMDNMREQQAAMEKQLKK
jgi:hypothetical protein